ncbi:hypothetical protein BST61_g1441 [Cercospora zeina]
MPFCEKCRDFFPSERFRIGCPHHHNNICSGCFDKHAIRNVKRTRDSKIPCLQCSRTLTEAGAKELMTRACRRAYFVMKRYFSVAAKKTGEDGEMSNGQAIEESGEEAAEQFEQEEHGVTEQDDGLPRISLVIRGGKEGMSHEA